MDFAELENDAQLIQKVENLGNTLDKLDNNLKMALQFYNYDTLSTADKAKYDLYLSYTANSLYWMYIKLNGFNPNDHEIKNELSRVREAMMRDKEIYERKTIRPVIDKAAAKRFIRHGLHDKESRDLERSEEELPKNKRIRFGDCSD